jgi:hypothetical protein
MTLLTDEVSEHSRGGNIGLVKFNRVIVKRVAYDRDGINFRADVNAAIAVNVDESSGEAMAQSDQRIARETRQTARASSSHRPKPDAPST